MGSSSRPVARDRGSKWNRDPVAAQPGDLERLRFVYSPLAEVAESLYVLHCGQIPDLHRAWFDKTRPRLRHVDMTTLRAIVPAPRPHVASFLLAGAREPSTSIEVQLATVADLPPGRLRADLEEVWRGELPEETRQIVEHGSGARIAEALRQYWTVGIKPYWPQIRAVLDADVGYRAARLARGGIEARCSRRLTSWLRRPPLRSWQPSWIFPAARSVDRIRQTSARPRKSGAGSTVRGTGKSSIGGPALVFGWTTG
jgi:hypothetical protein